MIKLSKTFCRKFAIDVLKLQNVPSLSRFYHSTCMKSDRHTTFSFTPTSYDKSYEVAMMRWCGGLWLRVLVYDDDDNKTEDYVLTYSFDWETGKVGDLTYDSRKRGC